MGFEKSKHFHRLLELLYKLNEHIKNIEQEFHQATSEVDEFFNWLGPLENGRETPQPWDPSKIKWVTAQSASGKGAYERYPDVGEKGETGDYPRLLVDLKAHDGKLMRDGFFYWLFQDGATIGRKRKGS